MTPYKYVVVSLPRSQSFWFAQSAGFDHDASVQLAQGCWKPKSEGLCDTGIYALPKELQDLAIGPETKIVRIRRRPADVIGSFLKHYPDANMNELCKLIDMLLDKLNAFCGERGVTVSARFPIDSVSLARIEQHFYGEPPIFQTRHDLMEFPGYKEGLQHLLPHVFP